MNTTIRLEVRRQKGDILLRASQKWNWKTDDIHPDYIIYSMYKELQCDKLKAGERFGVMLTSGDTKIKLGFIKQEYDGNVFESPFTVIAGEYTGNGDKLAGEVELWGQQQFSDYVDSYIAHIMHGGK